MQESVAEYITGPSNIVAVEHKMYSDDFASECYMAVSHDWAAGCTLHYTLCAIYTNTALWWCERAHKVSQILYEKNNLAGSFIMLYEPTKQISFYIYIFHCTKFLVWVVRKYYLVTFTSRWLNLWNFCTCRRWWVLILACALDVEACWLLVMSQRFTSVLSWQLLACSGVGAALVGGAWRGQRLGVVHVAGATLGLMAVVCVVWADVEGAPTDGKSHLLQIFYICKSLWGCL